MWAGGNGGSKDNVNYDGVTSVLESFHDSIDHSPLVQKYANSIYTIAVGSIDANGKKAYYSEEVDALHTPSLGTRFHS